MNFLFNADFLLLVKNFVLSNFFVVSENFRENRNIRWKNFASKRVGNTLSWSIYFYFFTWVYLGSGKVLLLLSLSTRQQAFVSRSHSFVSTRQQGRETRVFEQYWKTRY